jgi:catechol 2,3-dioxygenase-like lactoylglutathione lyase family enzyme
MMIDHVNLPVSDLQASRAFYERCLQALGYRLFMEDGEAIGFGVNSWGFGIVAATTSCPAMHIAFKAVGRGDVDRFFEAAIAAGGKPNGRPGLRPRYHKDYYAAFVLDPDGHNVEAVCRDSGTVA